MKVQWCFYPDFICPENQVPVLIVYLSKTLKTEPASKTT